MDYTFITVPVITSIVYAIIDIVKTATNSNEKFLKLVPLVACALGVIGGEAETNHVKGETTKDVEKFNAGIYHQTAESYTKATDKTSFTSNTGYLGAMSQVADDTSKTKSSLEVTAVAWFEGESTNVVSDKTMSKVTASLSFYARINAEA